MSKAEEYSQELRQVYHKHIIQNKYIKYNSATHVIDNVPVEAIGNAIQAHTNQTLQELKERVGGEQYNSDWGSEDTEYYRGYNDAIKEIIKLIDEAINE